MVIVVGIGCVSPWARSLSAAHHEKTAPTKYPVIVKLVSRSQIITVTAGPSGPLYSAQTGSGKSIVSNATLEQLRSEHQEIYRQIAPSTAGVGELDARAE